MKNLGDLKTEIAKEQGLYDGLDPETGKGGSYVRVSQTAFSLMVLMRSKSPTEFLILSMICAMVRGDNVAQLSPTMIKRALDISDSQYSRNMKALLRKNFVTKCHWHSNTYFFMLNPILFRKFKDEHCKQYVAIYEKNRAEMGKREKDEVYSISAEHFPVPLEQARKAPINWSNHNFDASPSFSRYYSL